MCNLDVNQSSFEDICLTKTTTDSIKAKYADVLRINSSNLEHIISASRMVIMMDCTKSRPRKIIVDTDYDNSRNNLHKTKETQLLSEIVFGNFSLSSKANGFKLHIIKNPLKMILSKLFSTPYNSIFYEHKSLSRKISPDSGNNLSSSSNSSHNSNWSCNSSNHSLNSSLIAKFSTSAKNSSPAVSVTKINSWGTNDCCKTNSNRINKSLNGEYFNENCVIYEKPKIMMSIIFTFCIPEESRVEFEDFIFHYYVLLESILNRISQLIFDNSFNIYNGSVINCWKQSKNWLISLLPKHLPEICNSINHEYYTKSLNRINTKNFEEIIEYFDKQNRLPFLAQIITGVMLSNQNSIKKFLSKPTTLERTQVFPYQHILQNIGFNIKSCTFKRIIVKGAIRDKYHDNPSSWKEKLTSSIKYYKNMLNNSSSELRPSVSPLDTRITLSPDNSSSNFLHRSPSVTCKDVEVLTHFLADLIRPVSTVAYQPHRLPVEYHVTLSDILHLNDMKTAIEIPLIDDGPTSHREILPQINELFYPNKIIDYVCPFIVPLQGLVEIHGPDSHETFLDQIFTESVQSEITYNNQTFHPSFIVIDTETSTVKISNIQILSSSWVERILTDILSLSKLADYCAIMGDLYMVSVLKEFSMKTNLLHEYITENQMVTIDPWFMNQYGLTDSDLPLFLSNPK